MALLTSVTSTHLWFTNASVVFVGQSNDGSRVLSTFNTEPPGMARAKCPRFAIASLAADSTMVCTAAFTSDSVERM